MSERDELDEVLDDVMPHLGDSWAKLSTADVVAVLRNDPYCPADMTEEQLAGLAERIMARAKERLS